MWPWLRPAWTPSARRGGYFDPPPVLLQHHPPQLDHPAHLEAAEAVRKEIPVTKDIRAERYQNVTDLTKYDHIYKVVNDGTNGPDMAERIWEWCIPGKYGQIYPVGFNGDFGPFQGQALVRQGDFKLLEGAQRLRLMGSRPTKKVKHKKRIGKT